MPHIPLDISNQLQFILVKRWVETSQGLRKFNDTLSRILKKYLNQIYDNIHTENPLLKYIKQKQGVLS